MKRVRYLGPVGRLVLSPDGKELVAGGDPVDISNDWYDRLEKDPTVEIELVGESEDPDDSKGTDEPGDDTEGSDESAETETGEAGDKEAGAVDAGDTEEETE